MLELMFYFLDCAGKSQSLNKFFPVAIVVDVETKTTGTLDRSGQHDHICTAFPNSKI